MTEDDVERWREHNRQVLMLGGTITTYVMADGSVEEYREINGQRVRNHPELKNELVRK